MLLHCHAQRDTLRAFNTWCFEAIRATGAFEATDLWHAPSLVAANEALYAAVPDMPTAIVWTCRATDHPYEGFLATQSVAYDGLAERVGDRTLLSPPPQNKPFSVATARN
jgi:hypothetical protein